MNCDIKMQALPVNITEEQREKLFERKKNTNIPVAAQIREAIDDYIKKHEET